MEKQEKYKCSECGSVVGCRKIFEIDGKHFCAKCVFGDVLPYEIYPIGVVRNRLKRNRENFGTTGPDNSISRIELHPFQQRFLHAIEEETRLTIVYYLNKRGPVRSVFKRGLDGKKAGVFATRTPDRLSGIGIQDVKLAGVEGTTLKVEGLDAIDGTPVLDIKMFWSAEKSGR